MTAAQGTPTLVLPFDAGRYEPESLVRHRAREVRERLEAAGLGHFVQGDDVMVDLICRTSPQAEADTIGPVAEWLLWLFPLDDLCEDVFAGSTTGAPADLAATGLPRAVTAGMDGFREDVTARMSPGWGERFRRDFDSYLRHAIRFAGTSTADDLPEPAEFLVLRREEGAAKPTIHLVEVVARTDLPEEFRGSAAWRGLHDACADVLTWTNDIYSYRKERRSGSRFNLVDVLVRHADLPEHDALARAVDMTNAKAREFVALVAELPRTKEFASLSERDRSGVLRCVTGMGYWMRGQYDWFVITSPARYQVLPRG
ncbi:terpene synthase family protein [Umezawaea tangerina]|uniref:Terpene synthase n=1 Tax=Umezawaea tangerina TaxID=84725 RepID=A0A2T0T6H6_9PSEU|nr:hypothetical protein [Umezawaea tangerina]PRY41274.1 hypothetical protein CLV43_10532 [Umezawaea tangerina]